MKLHRLTYPSDPLAMYGLDTRDLGDPNDAAATVAGWWAQASTAGVVTFTPSGHEDARYERPGLVTERLPEGWPRRAPRLGEDAALAEARRPIWTERTTPAAEVSLGFGDTHRPAPKAAPVDLGPGGPCRCCGRSPGEPEEARDQTPSGRLNRRCCPDCGQSWPDPSATVLDIQRRHVGTVRGGAQVLEGPFPTAPRRPAR